MGSKSHGLGLDPAFPAGGFGSTGAFSGGGAGSLSRPGRAAVSLIAILASIIAPPLSSNRIALPSLPPLAAPATVSAAAPILLRDPYLTDVTGPSAMVNLATDTSSPAPIVRGVPRAATARRRRAQ